MMAIGSFVVGGIILTDRIDALTVRLQNTQIDVTAATERALRAEQQAMRAVELLDSIQFSTSSRK
jgi:hypothetical protein